MELSIKGLNLIKEFEGCDLVAKKYKGEKYYTIGYGHYSEDVKEGQVITEPEASKLLINELKTHVAHVNSFNKYYNFNQNEFDAMVSFSYNVGSITKLTAKGTRNRDDIRKCILLYNKCSGVVLEGLTKRRKKELELFNTPCNVVDVKTNTDKYYPKCKDTCRSIVDALKSINVNASYSNRKKIAIANGISNYQGLGSQNTTLLILLKQGKLIRV